VVPVALTALLHEFEKLEDSDERAALLIEYAERFEEVPKKIADRPFDEAHKVPGCESEVYVWTVHGTDRRVKLYFAVENPQGISAKALAVILDESLSGLTPEELEVVPDNLALSIFGAGLSMGKGLGLTSMVRTVKYQAKL